MAEFTGSYEDNGYWGICGADGVLYTGTWHTRKEAIDAHVMALFGTLEDRGKSWEKCRAKGDRATKLRIIYEWKV